MVDPDFIGISVRLKMEKIENDSLLNDIIPSSVFLFPLDILHCIKKALTPVWGRAFHVVSGVSTRQALSGGNT
ncbi:MAG: hypothetical protein FVQ77_10755 [Cytophagales bacterium]|nr:hypothetical protein [Cytophagales bacterium]